MNTETTKGQLHPRNRHQGRYDFAALVASEPTLEQFVAENKYGDLSIDFSDDKAVKALNKALLKCYYNLEYWDIPPYALTPPIPGRADYIHYLSDLIQTKKPRKQKCLDIGVGANCIYPIIGSYEYGWEFVGCDIEEKSLVSAQKIVDSNPRLRELVELRLQSNKGKIFEGVVGNDEYFDACMCNPPFHNSAASAQKSSMRKVRNLKAQKSGKAKLNFGGQDNELWCEGGELSFIKNIIDESRSFRTNFRWFTTLVSNQDNLPALQKHLRGARVEQSKVIEMYQGNKRSRILAWRY